MKREGENKKRKERATENGGRVNMSIEGKRGQE